MKIIMKNRLKSFINLSVKKYSFNATLDVNTCDTCGDLDGQIFTIKDAIFGVNCPPMHKGCRCTVTPVTSGKTEERWFRNPATGKGEIGPYQTYKEFKKRYIE